MQIVETPHITGADRPPDGLPSSPNGAFGVSEITPLRGGFGPADLDSPHVRTGKPTTV
jgi:hypothetical protein